MFDNTDFADYGDVLPVILPCIACTLAISVPLYDCFLFVPNERNQYMRKFHRKGLFYGPSICVFMFLISFWNLVLPFFDISIHMSSIIIGSVYLYIVMLYSIVDEASTPAMVVYFIFNMLITIGMYDVHSSYNRSLAFIFILVLFGELAYSIHMNFMPLKKHAQWYMWYAGTMGGMLRW
jgi:hypothetical protein